jgi:hypothetical protein
LNSSEMKYLIYTFLLFSLAPLGLAKGNSKCYQPCAKKSCCVKMHMAERQLANDIITDIKGLFVRDNEEVDSEKF